MIRSILLNFFFHFPCKLPSFLSPLLFSSLSTHTVPLTIVLSKFTSFSLTNLLLLLYLHQLKQSNHFSKATLYLLPPFTSHLQHFPDLNFWVCFFSSFFFTLCLLFLLKQTTLVLVSYVFFLSF